MCSATNASTCVGDNVELLELNCAAVVGARVGNAVGEPVRRVGALVGYRVGKEVLRVGLRVPGLGVVLVQIRLLSKPQPVPAQMRHNVFWMQ